MKQETSNPAKTDWNNAVAKKKKSHCKHKLSILFLLLLFCCYYRNSFLIPMILHAYWRVVRSIPLFFFRFLFGKVYLWTVSKIRAHCSVLSIPRNGALQLTDNVNFHAKLVRLKIIALNFDKFHWQTTSVLPFPHIPYSSLFICFFHHSVAVIRFYFSFLSNKYLTFFLFLIYILIEHFR